MPADPFFLESRDSSQYKRIIFNIDRNSFIDFAVNPKRFTLLISDIPI